MTTLLPISLQNSVYEIMDQSNLRGAAVRAILLSTTEGVPLGRVVVQPSTDEQQQHSHLNVDVLASIESVWAPASKQFPVLGLDKLKQVTAIYNHGTLIHIYQAPMVGLFIAERIILFFLNGVFDWTSLSHIPTSHHIAFSNTWYQT
jgi:hypothetical protein